jgi:hypothetical protein
MATRNDNADEAMCKVYDAVALIEMARTTVDEICGKAPGTEITHKAFAAGVGLDEALPKLKEVTRLLDGPGPSNREDKADPEQIMLPLATFDDITLRTERVSTLLRSVWNEIEGKPDCGDATVLVHTAQGALAEVDELLRGGAA